MDSKVTRLLKFLERCVEIKYIRDRASIRCVTKEKGTKVVWLQDIKDTEGFSYNFFENDGPFELVIKRLPEPEIPKDFKDLFREEWKRIDKSEIFEKIEDYLYENKDEEIKFLYEEYKKEKQRYEKSQEIYDEFWNFWRGLDREPDKFELLLGIGLLVWTSAKSDIKYRNFLITVKTSITSDSKSGTFYVSLDEGIDLKRLIRVELTDFLDISDVPDGFNNIREKFYETIEESGLTLENINNFLRETALLLHSQGQFREDFIPELNEFPEVPIISLSPAIILRERNITPLLSFTQELHKFAELSPIFLTFAEEFPESSLEVKEATGKQIDEEFAYEFVHFPKPFNEEQKKIVEKIESNRVVLVKGPPGTGKSHTIANLICHFLAHGKRMLITCKSDTALRVLKSLIPEELRNFCVSIIGSGRDELKEMEESISALKSQIDSILESELEERLKEIEQKLEYFRIDKYKYKNLLEKCLTNNSTSQEVPFTKYKGGPYRIAKLFDEERHKFEWLEDEIEFTALYPFGNLNLSEFLRDIREFSREESKLEINYTLPDINSLIDINTLNKLFSEIFEKKQELDRLEKSLDKSGKGSPEFYNVTENQLRTIVNKLKEYKQFLLDKRYLLEKYKTLLHKIVFALHKKLIDERIDQSNKFLKKILEIYHRRKNHEIYLSDNISIDKILFDLNKVKTYLKSGGKREWIFSIPKDLEGCFYLFENVIIDGKKGLDLDRSFFFFKKRRINENFINSFSEIIEFIISYNELQKSWELADTISSLPKHFTLQKFYENLDYIKDFLSLLGKSNEIINYVKSELGSRAIGEFNLLNIGSLEELILLIELKRKKAEFESLQGKISIYKNSLINYSNVPVIKKILNALENKNIQEYAEGLEKILEISKKQASYRAFQEKLKQFEKYLPKLTLSLLENPYDEVWEERFKILKDGWEWLQAKDWLRKYNEFDLQEINLKLKSLEDEERNLIKELCKLKATKHLKSKISIEDRRHLEAWAHSIKKIGRGTGKYAQRNRKAAQKYLSKVKQVIPAWIMPMYKVWDTIRPEKEMFDVLIIDEASQVDFEGLFLLGLAKRVIVIGDDKQIAPEGVGIERSLIHRLQRELLDDFKFSDLFDIETSLFTHMQIRYSHTRVFLTEHFRCMPEIIAFCNELCYNDPESRLIPLRQYPPDRLDPLQVIFIENAECEGDDQNIRNRKEAEAIAEKIAELCQDERYKGKTMGIIVLQGSAQIQQIEKAIRDKKVPQDQIITRKIVCGNPYAFQGDERDIIFLSMVIAPNKGRFGILNKETDIRRFNVAVSRARDQIWLFHSVNIDDLRPDCCRRKLLEHFYRTEVKKIAGISYEKLKELLYLKKRNRFDEGLPQPFESWFEVDVALELCERGYQVIPQYEVGSYRIDLVIEGGQNRIAIECDGDKYHGLDRLEKDLFRQRVLERAGWKFFRIRASEFYYNRAEILKNLQIFLNENGIKPRVGVNLIFQ